MRKHSSLIASFDESTSDKHLVIFAGREHVIGRHQSFTVNKRSLQIGPSLISFGSVCVFSTALKMLVNPMNVINLLLISFQTLNLPQTPTNQKELELKSHIESILLSAMNEFNGIEVITEESLDFQEPYKDVNAQIIEDEILHHDPDYSQPPTEYCTDDDEELTFDYKARAVEYWRDTKLKKNRNIDSVRQKFKLVKSKNQLQRWAKSLNKGGTYREKISRICQFTLDNFKSAIESGLIVHDNDLRKWALQARKEINADFRFKASTGWLKRFKKAHRIVSRKINKFISKKTLENAEELKQKAHDFVLDVKQEIQNFGFENVYNADQSGFELEMRSGRTLTEEGTKQVECVVESVPSTTHSYTVYPLISSKGKLFSPLFLVSKEPTGKFGPIVEQNLFKPNNIYLVASKSGKMTSDHFKIWLREVFFPNVGPRSLLLVDSWSGHCPAVVTEATPKDKSIIVKKILTGTTGQIQPLDVYGFRQWKNFVRHFSDKVTLMNYDLNLHLRNNIIKLQSLVYNQLSSPRYINLFKYSWYESGYIDEKPESFEDPVDFSFGDSCETHCQIEGCKNVAIIRCAWCKKSLCLKHFFDDYHYCTTYQK